MEEKAYNILQSILLNLGVWNNLLYKKFTKEENLNLVRQAREELDKMERLLNAS